VVPNLFGGLPWNHAAPQSPLVRQSVEPGPMQAAQRLERGAALQSEVEGAIPGNFFVGPIPDAAWAWNSPAAADWDDDEEEDVSGGCDSCDFYAYDDDENSAFADAEPFNWNYAYDVAAASLAPGSSFAAAPPSGPEMWAPPSLQAPSAQPPGRQTAPVVPQYVQVSPAQIQAAELNSPFISEPPASNASVFSPQPAVRSGNRRSRQDDDDPPPAVAPEPLAAPAPPAPATQGRNRGCGDECGPQNLVPMPPVVRPQPPAPNAGNPGQEGNNRGPSQGQGGQGGGNAGTVGSSGGGNAGKGGSSGNGNGTSRGDASGSSHGHSGQH